MAKLQGRTNQGYLQQCHLDPETQASEVTLGIQTVLELHNVHSLALSVAQACSWPTLAAPPHRSSSAALDLAAHSSLLESAARQVHAKVSNAFWHHEAAWMLHSCLQYGPAKAQQYMFASADVIRNQHGSDKTYRQ